MELEKDEIDLIIFLKRKALKDALFFLIISAFLLPLFTYLLVDNILHGNVSLIIILSILMALVIYAIYLGICSLLDFISLRKDYFNPTMLSVSGKPSCVKLTIEPKSRKNGSPAIDDIIFYFDDNGRTIKAKYHIMYNYLRRDLDKGKIVEALKVETYSFSYLKNSHHIVAVDSKINEILEDKLKRVIIK